MPYLKKAVTKITLEFEDETYLLFEGPARFSQSENSRKNGATWDEFHVTWIIDRTPQPVEKPVEEIRLQGVRAEDYMDDPNFAGIEYGQPRYRKQRTQFNFDDFGFEFLGGTNGSG